MAADNATSASANTRSVEDLRRKYSKELIKLGGNGSGVCQHCGAVTKKIVHYRSM
jgi:hypothetical protein